MKATEGRPSLHVVTSRAGSYCAWPSYVESGRFFLVVRRPEPAGIAGVSEKQKEQQMFTVKHVERDGFEVVVQARDAMFHPGRQQCGDDPGHVAEFVAYGVPGPNEGARLDGVVRYGSGTIYVMNEAGKTVSCYHL